MAEFCGANDESLCNVTKGLVGLDDRSLGLRFQAGHMTFSLLHRVQNGSGAHPASYPMGTRGCFLGR